MHGVGELYGPWVWGVYIFPFFEIRELLKSKRSPIKLAVALEGKYVKRQLMA